MRRNKKLRIRRTIIVVTALLLILFGAFLIIEKLGNRGEEPSNLPDNPEEEETSVEPENPQEENPQEENPQEEEPEDFQEPPEPEKPEPKEEDPVQEQPDDEPGITIENPEKLDVLVNRKRNLPENYVPEDLVTLGEVPTVLSNPEVNQLRSAAYEALKEMFTAASETGNELHARSGYRSYYTQSSLYSSYVNSYGKAAADKYSAKPGQSEHQTGLSIDITCEAVNYKLDTAFAETEEGKWVAENAHNYGFIIRYPKGKEKITGYEYEPWHIRYLGEDLAEKLYESGLTMEEYFQ